MALDKEHLQYPRRRYGMDHDRYAKVLREEQPTHVVVAIDPPGGSFRKQIYPDYKANRDKQPEDLTAQLPLVESLCAAYGVPMLSVEGFEADDVIASLVEQAPASSEVCIVSTDKDLMQLVAPGIEMLDTMKGKRIDQASVEERFGVPPSQLLDLRALEQADEAAFRAQLGALAVALAG